MTTTPPRPMSGARRSRCCLKDTSSPARRAERGALLGAGGYRADILAFDTGRYPQPDPGEAGVRVIPVRTIYGDSSRSPPAPGSRRPRSSSTPARPPRGRRRRPRHGWRVASSRPRRGLPAPAEGRVLPRHAARLLVGPTASRSPATRRACSRRARRACSAARPSSTTPRARALGTTCAAPGRALPRPRSGAVTGRRLHRRPGPRPGRLLARDNGVPEERSSSSERTARLEPAAPSDALARRLGVRRGRRSSLRGSVIRSTWCSRSSRPWRPGRRARCCS